MHSTMTSTSVTVLVVDDDRDARHIFQLALEYAGHTVLIAHDGAEGVELAERHEPDVILMDVMMPRVDGVTALQAIRAATATKGTPVIAITALASPSDLETLRPAGFSELLLKPVFPMDVVDAVRRWTAEPRPV
jgi:CheY-like chemotaxis protein